MANAAKKGSLLVVGTGIGFAGQCTIEARNAIVGADLVLSIMGDALMQRWLEELNPKARSMQDLYARAPNRPAAYAAMVDELLKHVRRGLDVCAVFYGHPGVFVHPSHEAVRRARAEGCFAKMLPGVSAEDCLFADLGVDPGAIGCQSYEARDFLLSERRIDPSAALVLWQIAVTGDDTLSLLHADSRGLLALAAALMETYPADHLVTVYTAAALPVQAPSADIVALRDLANARVTQASTLYVPPIARPQVSSRRRALLDACLGRPPAS